MGLDIYAGTLTRYYAHNWKTAVQQWAEENGYSFSRITPDGDPINHGGDLSPAEIQKGMEDWRDQILDALTPEGGPAYTPWTEDNETPYYTDKPDWDAFGALLLYTACMVYGEPVPAAVQKDWDFKNHPAIQRLARDEERVWSLLRGATWWLPIEDSLMFQGPLPTGDGAIIATTGGLKKELEKLNALNWRADEETILSWADIEGYPMDTSSTGNSVFSKEEIPEHTLYDTEPLAKYAFSMLWRASSFSLEYRVPVLLDY